MKKIISFSLWGDSHKYLNGAIRNAALARELFPDWICRFYVGSSVPFKIIEELINPIPKRWCRYKVDKENTISLCGSFNPLIEIYHMDFPGDWRMMMDRFLPIVEDDIDYMIVRDCDSRLSLQEKMCVDEWISSGKSLHMIHAHPWHCTPILGGLFGLKGGSFPLMKYIIDNWKEQSAYQIDQNLLRDKVWPKFSHGDFLNHDEFFGHLWKATPFPIKRDDGGFMGESFDENDKPNKEHREILQKFLRKRR